MNTTFLIPSPQFFREPWMEEEVILLRVEIRDCTVLTLTGKVEGWEAPCTM